MPPWQLNYVEQRKCITKRVHDENRQYEKGTSKVGIHIFVNVTAEVLQYIEAQK